MYLVVCPYSSLQDLVVGIHQEIQFIFDVRSPTTGTQVHFHILVLQDALNAAK